MSDKRNKSDAPEMTIDNVTYIKLADYARIHDANGDRLRGMARDGKLPDAKQLFGKMWVIPIGATVPPTSPHATARADGRRPYTVYANDVEYATLDAQYDTVDPRAVSRARRAANKTSDNASD